MPSRSPTFPRMTRRTFAGSLGIAWASASVGASAEPNNCGAVDPNWPKTLTVLTDSVALVLGNPLRAALPGWSVVVRGRPALMVNQAVSEFLAHKNVGSIVVVGLGYNSQFEKERKHAERWSALWNYRAEHLLTSLAQRGAKKVVWLTLREPSLAVVTAKGRAQYDLYAWFFPYVNELIRGLAERHPEVVIADWASVSNVADVTTDLIHLNGAGSKLMSELIARAVLGTDSCEASTRAEPKPPRTRDGS